TPQLIADGSYYVVEIDGQLAGAGGWSNRKTLYGGDQAKAETEDNRLDPSRDAAKIRAFYVDPHRARQGIGRQLLRVCETAARQAGFTRLELMATLTGMPLYAACGFRVVTPAEIEMPDGIRLPVAKMEKIITSP
ncbi:MAG TPA: GNAT family N-acetyltransferase, partial [Anaerolineae bacterium]|nr:GNAT family N-acetyltransferase [Anaerolineae bacterium]